MEPHDVTWQQGDDLTFNLIYKQGPTGSEVPVNLTTGYSVRMDIVTSTGERLYTFNSESIADVDPETVGAQPDDTSEAALGAAGQIDIAIDRALTLPGGPLYAKMEEVPPVTVFFYDIFLREPYTGTPADPDVLTTGRQRKILKGSITVETSYTLWL